jgi:hypothetical protein
MKQTMVRWLESDAEKAAARADAAKQQVRAAKAALKLARKLFKTEKKAAKQARKKAKAALAAARPQKARPQKARPPKARPAKPARTGKSMVKAPAAKRRIPKTVPVVRKSRRMRKPRADASPEYLRSAADVAKSVIDRLQSPLPALPPAPSIPAEVKPEEPV